MSITATQTLTTDVWLENRRGTSTLGIGESRPRLSWLSPLENTPAAVEIELSDNEGRRDVAAVDPHTTRLIDWPFHPLRSREQVQIRLHITQHDGRESWSQPLTIEAGLLERQDWSVPFISPSPSAPQGTLRPGYLLRAEFDAEDLGIDRTRISQARIYSTAHGMYELEMNGKPVSDELLAPGWTSYTHRIRYQTTDITRSLLPGRNAIGVWLADGWYRGRIGFDGGVWDAYGPDVSVLLQLELTLDDGAVVIVPLENSWRHSVSPIIATGLYEGETYDARAFPTGWSTPHFDDSDWHTPSRLELADHAAVIEAPTGPPVRVTETLRPTRTEVLPSGRIRLDFGQNIAGRLRIRVNGPAGHELRLHHAEVIEDGLLGTRPLRTAISIDTYTCSGGDGIEEWSPRFTIHGFQYAELENWPGSVEDVDVEALVIHTDMERTGWFDSSHPGLNRLHENVVWSMRDNFVDLPTDCPQRDERAGWTGDIQVFTPTALYLYGAHGTLTGWLRDLAFEQQDQGHVPNFVPWIECGFPNFPTAAWGDAAVIVPWELYRHDGDTRVLAEQYQSMKDWVDLVYRLTGETGLWNTGFQLGDWLDPAAPPDHPGNSQTDKYLVATAYHVKTARILADVARILGNTDDAERYTEIAGKAATAFREEYLSETGRVVSDTVASLAIALVFNLFATTEQAAHAGRRLVDLVAASGYHITTGFVGTPIICDALTIAGSVDSAYRLLLQDELPSWLYPVSMGATTVWERWDSMLPDGSINPGGMTSFNHYALGAVADFMHRVVAGLSTEGIGGRALRIAPQPGGGLTRASAEHRGPLGTASASWTRIGTTFELDVEVPPGATATVILPGTSGETIPVGPGRHHFTSTFTSAEDDQKEPTP
ncbi:alpha-L-rhamnosidase [Subtercola sp. Z020]|uniref:alpha-L-rhamnosidase n=1 Tax=Subtercola sp. Z020 TaxID=2080582 RepID=UPI000CE8E6A3|nr:alpha-L-rhamnosidase [Subtercola sp. Z020]PPF79301.1 alpha-L-rhamnosidase [Subtercola sp. Z020]